MRNGVALIRHCSGRPVACGIIIAAALQRAFCESMSLYIKKLTRIYLCSVKGIQFLNCDGIARDSSTSLGMTERSALPNGRDYFELNGDRRGQCSYFDRGPRWIWFAGTGEVFGVELVVDRKVFLHVGKKDGDIDDVVPSRAGVFQDEANIFKYGTTLHLDIVIRDIAGRIASHTGDFFAAAHARSNPGEKKEIADALRVRERADRFRCARTFKRFAHLCRRMIANHALGPPSENFLSLNFGFTSIRAGSIDSTCQPRSKASYNSCRDTRRGPSVPGSSSLKHIRKSWPPISSTCAK